MITGGGRGLGRVFTRSFVEAGANVIITGRNQRTLGEVSQELGGLETRVFDISDASATRAAFDDIHQTHGAIDVLVNNAGICNPPGSFWETPLKDWESTLDVNLKGTVYCTHVALQVMVTQGNGIIINLASSAGVFRWPTCSAYSVSKASIVKLTENLSYETRHHGVSLFAYHPGLVHSTGLGADHLINPAPEDSPLGLAQKWFTVERQAGRTVDAQQSIGNLLKLASGTCAALSGCYLTVHDDLERLMADREPLRTDNLMLRVRQHSPPERLPRS
ncbi:SDR family oxidoreductase [Myxococcus landrumensis]|uniref:SDR family oxidoreductase n=1 Tax=Myxococcus landrumensis TaxID=2813577 RepID=A0ABX7N686_9BACT|nr:SDR family oxidoreductase [Myxococcus landrumus]QSQ14148.1 SDR family oxidoreductase [Myxococcus landrumus]